MFPTIGFQIITEPCSPEDPPCLGRTSYPTDALTLVRFPHKRKSYLQILFAVMPWAGGLARIYGERPSRGALSVRLASLGRLVTSVEKPHSFALVPASPSRHAEEKAIGLYNCFFVLVLRQAVQSTFVRPGGISRRRDEQQGQSKRFSRPRRRTKNELDKKNGPVRGVLRCESCLPEPFITCVNVSTPSASSRITIPLGSPKATGLYNCLLRELRFP